ncbi:hypothetical protein J7M00_05965 [bacterium]|nr:hypothetical protein [bacterium]
MSEAKGKQRTGNRRTPAFSHREKVDCDEVARQMRGTNKPCEILSDMRKER